MLNCQSTDNDSKLMTQLIDISCNDSGSSTAADINNWLSLISLRYMHNYFSECELICGFWVVKTVAFAVKNPSIKHVAMEY